MRAVASRGCLWLLWAGSVGAGSSLRVVGGDQASIRLVQRPKTKTMWQAAPLARPFVSCCGAAGLRPGLSGTGGPVVHTLAAGLDRVVAYAPKGTCAGDRAVKAMLFANKACIAGPHYEPVTPARASPAGRSASWPPPVRQPVSKRPWPLQLRPTQGSPEW